MPAAFLRLLKSACFVFTKTCSSYLQERAVLTFKLEFVFSHLSICANPNELLTDWVDSNDGGPKSA